MQDFCLHIHTPRCGHAEKTLWEADIARLFYNAGFKTIAFTDHNPWKHLLENFRHHAMNWSEKEEYLESIHKLADEYKGKMRIITGFEQEYIPTLKDEMEELRAIADFMIVGQHFTLDENGNVLSIHRKDYIPTDSELDSYANCLEAACKEGYAQIIAHPDLYMFHKTEFGTKETEIAERICSTAVKYDVPIEINLDRIWTNRFIMPDDIAYPTRNFWKIAADFKKIRVLYGLDFHGYIDPVHHNELIAEANDIIGKDLISGFHFCTVDEII